MHYDWKTIAAVVAVVSAIGGMIIQYDRGYTRLDERMGGFITSINMLRTDIHDTMGQLRQSIGLVASSVEGIRERMKANEDRNRTNEDRLGTLEQRVLVQDAELKTIKEVTIRADEKNHSSPR